MSQFNLYSLIKNFFRRLHPGKVETSPFDPYPLIETLFRQLRQQGFNLGLEEYLAAVETVTGGFVKTPDELRAVLQLLWCHSRDEQRQYRLIWDSAIARQRDASSKSRQETIQKQEEFSDSPLEMENPALNSSLPETTLTAEPQRKLAPLPVCAPLPPVDSDSDLELQSYFPISKRNMVYSWRYLRRWIPDGVKDVLDVTQTVKETAEQGFYLAPSYRPRPVNHAHLLLLLDQDGSMTPFHRFSRELAETAQYESKIGRVDVYYFHNVVAESVYRDPYLTELILFKQVLADCERDTSILIVSDAGAARGDRRPSRIQATTEFLYQIRKQTSLVAWLNPLPEDRWRRTSAEMISYLLPMYPMNTEGLSHAIDTVRG